MMRFTLRAMTTAFTMLYTLLSIQACSLQGGEESVGLAVTDQPVREAQVINILQSREEDGIALREAIELYTSANPGVYINVRTVSSTADYRVALRSGLLSGEKIDIFQYSSGREARELADNLADLSNMTWIRGAAADTASAVIIDGKSLGIPYSLEGYGLLLNRDIFEAAEISPGGINTLDDLEQAFTTLKEFIAGGGASERFPSLRYVTDLPTQDKNYLGSYPADLLIRGCFGTAAEPPDVWDISYPESGETERFLRLLLRNGPSSDWEGTDGLSWQAQVEAFASGRTAVLLGDTECYRDIIALNPELEDRVALIGIPGEESYEGIGVGAPLYWGINAASDDGSKEAAKRFLAWLYQSESGTAALASRFGAVSPYLETGKETGLSTHRQMLAHIGKGDIFPMIWREFPGGWGTGSVASGLRSWISGDLEWEEILENCRESWAYGG